MNLSDFEGIYKWKFLIPSMYIISWLLLIFGPIFFPFAYQIYCVVIVVYSLLKTLGITFGALVSLIILHLTVKQIEKQKEKSGAKSQNRIDANFDMLYHAIVVPSYKEDNDVLLQTLNILAKSDRAKSQFIILLAMEAHEKDSDQKAKALINQTKKDFLYMTFTQHVVREGQAKGKASNVSWCVQHLEQILPQKLLVPLNDVMLTIIDADSWSPPQYFQKVQMQLRRRPQIKDRCMFSAPQIYTRNHLDVPVFNRIFDQMHSLVHLANLVAVHYSFPLSNYTISYNCAKRINWWDTCADAIGQDFHTCQKCYWKIKDQTVVTVPIYIPFNQLSLSTGQGYFNDVKARFWQAERHTLGVSDVAYNWNMLFKKRFKFRNFILTLLVTEVFAMAAVIPWALLGLGIQYKLVNNNSLHYLPMWSIDLLLNLTPGFTVSSYIFYEWWKRVSNNKIYHQKNDAWWRVLEYPILGTIALFGFSIPAFLLASFAVLCTQTEYRVAEKHAQKHNLHLHNQPQIQLPNKQDQSQKEKDRKQINTAQNQEIVVPDINPQQISKKSSMEDIKDSRDGQQSSKALSPGQKV